MENKFLRFLAHTGIIIAMFLILGLWGSEIEFADPNSYDGYSSTNGMMMPIIFILPFFFILHLVCDVMADWENVILSFFRGALFFIGAIGLILGSLLCQGILAQDFSGTMPTVFQAALVSCGAFSGFVGLYFYIGIGSEMIDMREKSFLIPVISYGISFVLNLILAILGHYVSPFFYSWLLFIIMAVATVVVIVCIFKFGADDVCDRIYPSGSYKPTPTATTPTKSLRERVLDALKESLDDIKNNPDKYIKREEGVLRIERPMSYTLDVEGKEIFFKANMYINSMDRDYIKSSKRELQGILESLAQEALGYAAEHDSYFNPDNWFTTAVVNLGDATEY